MSTNTIELRKEAYRLWGINNRKIVYDFPQFHGLASSEFIFKLDFATDKASWPRAYAIAGATDNQDTMMRIIMPVIFRKHYNRFNIDVSAWYDMPLYLHEQIIRIANDAKLKRTLSWYAKLWNKVLPSKYHFSDIVNPEDYVFAVSSHSNELAVRLMNN